MSNFSLILVSLFLIVGSSNLFSQSFKDFKNTNNGKYVYFSLTGVRDQDHVNEINNTLLKDANVTESSLNLSKNGCFGKMFLKNNIDADYFRKIILPHQVDFDPASIVDYSKSYDTKVSAHYPLFINTGNQEKDNKIFDDAKKLWLKNYPKEVIQLTNNDYYEVVADEDFFKNEKPVFIDTGNSELDKEIFEKRTQIWNKKK